MVQLINDIPAHVAAFTFSGDITKDDYDQVIWPRVQQLAETNTQLSLLFVLHTELKNFTLGAWAQDALVGLKNLVKLNRIAIVSDSPAAKAITVVTDKVAPGEYKVFPLAQEEEAKSWVGGSAV